MNDSILLKIPSKPDYISIARLACSAIGSRVGLDIDDIEDLKVSIGEACINSLSISKSDTISVDLIIEEEKLIIKVSGVSEDIPGDIEESKGRELGILIIKSLMDEVIFDETGIIMTKFIM